MSKKSHHFLTLWPWPLTYDLEKLIRSGHYHYQCVYQIWEQSIPWFLSYRVNTIAGGGRLRRKTITSPDPSDTGDIIKNEIEDHYQSIPKLTGMLTELRCIIGQNLEILTSTGGEWSCGQAQNCVNFDFQVKFHLEGQGQSTPKTIGMLTKLFCMSGSNLVILAGIGDKLSRGQARDWRPHGQTQATTIPEGQNWPRVKTESASTITLKDNKCISNALFELTTKIVNEIQTT